MEKVPVRANFFEISDRMLARIFQTIDQSLKNVGKRTNIIDEETNVSYCISYSLDDYMTISVVDLGPTPNASLLPILVPIYGEPEKMYAKPWVLNPAYTILIMFWENVTINNTQGVLQ
ncbi:hypothetical protein B7C51_15880 [Paenibacillus larvae subsp. pulvifaciens]|uniref:Uncharacterized protein n=1 Tax=Paenibacillus larvae subsp. pulvifaciens TaxID=1477 RepID=A0A1V0UUP8_9BACL|nr:hypothetical protein [Paenibacillus larvae]ARF68969.1 hypothetical protein B7C51_15880 [Paenibacillus larvae subsp. pulvifaciens]